MMDENDLPYLLEMRMVTTDLNGAQVLVGLTAEETAWFFAHIKRPGGSIRDDAAEARYLALYDKHTAARFQVMGAEDELETNKPTRN